MAWINRPKKKRPIDTQRQERMAVYNTRRWRRLRLSHLREHPLCQMCEAKGRITPGTDVHHIQTFTQASDPYERDTLAFDPDNLMTLCDKCHAEIHHKH